MYTPSKFSELDKVTLTEFVQQYPLATLVTQSNNQLDAMHLPLQWQFDGESELLRGHIARVNPLWKYTENGDEVLAIFNGPNAYVSPNHYPSKLDSGKVVPTWNYSVVHVRGRVKFYYEDDWLLDLVESLTNANETGQSLPWKVEDAPQDYTKRLLKAIVGIEIEVDSMEGKFKLSQNKSEQDRDGVINGLASSESISENLLSKQMQSQINGR